MSLSSASAVPQYTILRIKRKITEDPLDQLVIDGSRPKKKTRDFDRPDPSGRGVFRLAETVKEDWREGEGGEALKKRIAQLMAEAKSKPPAPEIPIVSPRPVSSTKQPVRYMIVNPLQPSVRSRRPNRAPEVLATPDPSLPLPSAPALKVIDAHQINTTSSQPGQDHTQNQILLGKEEEEDPQMAAFLPMLRDYLAISNPESTYTSTASSSSSSSRARTPSRPNPVPAPAVTPSSPPATYVYDLYYRDISSGAQLSSAEGLGAMATVEGYLGDDGELVGSDGEEEEIDEEVDEDSNDEDFYRNDYPDEEDSEDDFFDSDAEDRWEEDY
ncbi:Transcription factor Iwr1 [Phaffia rhodozyma]|uniref:Probable RNA polymerase II nuclear localization protein SLC7A6OS n=1 Tax=Phaffia rhodozyma TaxID=264483 RepID=A0A0F7SMW6_PHARH|nr:Transcription factor Iwr1 [Phaffia rhodozyma]